MAVAVGMAAALDIVAVAGQVSVCAGVTDGAVEAVGKVDTWAVLAGA